MSLNYYTQTPNFISASADDIDPRTRLFSFNHSLTTLVGNYDMGPSLDLTLTYSPTTTDNIWGMGTGMMFTLTWYDKNARTLYLNSGETYRIDESTDGSGTVYFNMLQCKIKTFNVEKIDNGTGEIWYRVTDRDGNITELYEQDTGYFLPVTLWSPLGHSMTLSWTRDPDTGHLYLSQVTDETTDEATQRPRVLFSAVYSSGLVMTLLPGTDSEQTFTLNTSGGYLKSMTNSALTDSATPPVQVTTQGNTTLRNETFTYDVRNRMTDYVCTGSAPVQDAYGHAVSELHFTLDVYNNITHCQTVLADNEGTDEAEYTSNPDDPCQLMTVTHTLSSHYPASIMLAYDDNGRMTTDEAGRTLTYDDAGRLISVTGEEGNSQYAYDAFNTLVTQSLSGDTRELYYAGSRLLSEVHVEQNQITRNIPGCWGTSAVSDESL